MQVNELTPGMLFTLPVSGNTHLFRFVRNETDESLSITTSIIVEIAGYWPEGHREKGQPAQWVYTERGEQNCNPYAEAKLL